jgi:hypothetical protein
VGSGMRDGGVGTEKDDVKENRYRRQKIPRSKREIRRKEFRIGWRKNKIKEEDDKDNNNSKG